MIERVTDRRHAVNRREKIKFSKAGFIERITLVTQGVDITYYSESKETDGSSQRLYLVGLG